MAVEIVWLGVAEPNRDPRPRCRHCARILTCAPVNPAEAEPHCASRGCRDCDECSTGMTSVSPLARAAAHRAR